MTAPRSRPRSATAGVGNTPARTALPPAEAMPRANASSSSGPLARVSRPTKMRPRPHQSAAALPRRSTRSAVRVSPTTPRTPSVPKYCRATARDDSGLDREHELAADVPLAEGAQRVLRLGELVGTVDRRLQRTALEHVRECLEVFLVELRHEELDRLPAEARGEPDGRDMPQLAAATVGADDHEPTLRLESPTEGVPRVASGDVGDQVVALALTREVLAGVVEHAVGAEGPRLLDVACAAHSCDVGAERLRDLDGERADTARGAVDQHALARLEIAVVSEALERSQARDPHRRGLLERDVGRLADDVERAHVLGEGAAPAAEYLVSGGQVGHVLPHGLHDSREIGAEKRALR